MSFRRVAKINNIVCFDKLTSLSLSNNRIKEVTNIEHLVTLTALDMSFNQIVALPESLVGLVNLRELSLHSNGLRDLKIVDKLPRLTVLNVGEMLLSLAKLLSCLSRPHQPTPACLALANLLCLTLCRPQQDYDV